MKLYVQIHCHCGAVNVDYGSTIKNLKGKEYKDIKYPSAADALAASVEWIPNILEQFVGQTTQRLSVMSRELAGKRDRSTAETTYMGETIKLLRVLSSIKDHYLLGNHPMNELTPYCHALGVVLTLNAIVVGDDFDTATYTAHLEHTTVDDIEPFKIMYQQTMESLYPVN
jgi:hypothetical protein